MGAADDLAKATEIARSMVVRFGMDPDLGQVTYEPEVAPLLGMPSSADWRPRRYGESTATAIDTAVRGLVDTAFKRAVAILRRNREVLDVGAKELLNKETMTQEDLARVSSRLQREETLEIVARR